MPENIANTAIEALRLAVSTNAANFADDMLTFANALHEDNNSLGSAIFLDAGTDENNLVQLRSGGVVPRAVLPDATQGASGAVSLASETVMNVGTDNTQAVTPVRLRNWYNSRATKTVLVGEDYLTTNTARSDAATIQDPLRTYTVPANTWRLVVKVHGAGGGGGAGSTGTGNNARTEESGTDGGRTSVSLNVDLLVAEGGHPGAGGSNYDGRPIAGGSGSTIVIPGKGAVGGQGAALRGGDDREIESQNGMPGGLVIASYDVTAIPRTFTYRLGLGGLGATLREQGTQTGSPGANGYIIVQRYERVKA